MTRALGPRIGLPPEAAMPFTVLALAWTPVAGLGAVWLGGHTASALTGAGWQGPAFGWDFARTLLRAGVQGAWPDVPPLSVWACTATLVLTVAVPGLWVALTVNRRRAVPGDPLSSLASREDVAVLAAPASIERA